MFSRAYSLNADYLLALDILTKREAVAAVYNIEPNYGFYEPVFMGYVQINLMVSLDNPNSFESSGFDSQFGRGAAERSLESIKVRMDMENRKRLEAARLEAQELALFQDAARLMTDGLIEATTEEEPEVSKLLKRRSSSGVLKSAFTRFTSGSSFRNLLSLSPISSESTNSPATTGKNSPTTPTLVVSSPISLTSPESTARKGFRLFNKA